MYSPFLAQSIPTVALGVYDPQGDFGEENILIEHHFVPWRLNDTQELKTALESAKQRDRLPLISLEPWPWEWNEMVGETLFTDILTGKYDPTLKQIFKLFREENSQKILLRWGHEMEIIGQYPWSSANPRDYIAAYQYIVDLSRSQGVNNLLWVWSPAGNQNAKYYWPGADYVDFIGISIYATKHWNKSWNGQEMASFQHLMRQKYGLANHFNKPLIVAEVGVAGDAIAKTKWLKQAMMAIVNFPRLKAWVYFNQVQPDIVPLSIGQPHWELERSQVKQLVKTWQNVNQNRLSSENIQEFLETAARESIN
ncbi:MULTISPECIES: glycosyl hydrolase [Spirulina sp. CCY15215]|uniref:glycoside hydrolase family 26 protein n=1 Tax=Spirulina sp. CCY15215 TaxID=2767591 RepID=UPI001950104A|nr:glycosyl hydrolase [Spirulina major]